MGIRGEGDDDDDDDVEDECVRATTYLQEEKGPSEQKTSFGSRSRWTGGDGGIKNVPLR